MAQNNFQIGGGGGIGEGEITACVLNVINLGENCAFRSISWNSPVSPIQASS